MQSVLPTTNAPVTGDFKFSPYGQRVAHVFRVLLAVILAFDILYYFFDSFVNLGNLAPMDSVLLLLGWVASVFAVDLYRVQGLTAYVIITVLSLLFNIGVIVNLSVNQIQSFINTPNPDVTLVWGSAVGLFLFFMTVIFKILTMVYAWKLRKVVLTETAGVRGQSAM